MVAWIQTFRKYHSFFWAPTYANHARNFQDCRQSTQWIDFFCGSKNTKPRSTRVQPSVCLFSIDINPSIERSASGRIKSPATNKKDESLFRPRPGARCNWRNGSMPRWFLRRCPQRLAQCIWQSRFGIGSMGVYTKRPIDGLLRSESLRLLNNSLLHP